MFYKISNYKDLNFFHKLFIRLRLLKFIDLSALYDSFNFAKCLEDLERSDKSFNEYIQDYFLEVF